MPLRSPSPCYVLPRSVLEHTIEAEDSKRSPPASRRDRSCYFRPGGKSFSSFCAPLLSLSWFFSCFLLGSRACWAAPIQTSFLAAGSYMPRTKVPMVIVEVVAENDSGPPPHGPQPPHPPQPFAKPLSCLSRSIASW